MSLNVRGCRQRSRHSLTAVGVFDWLSINTSLIRFRSFVACHNRRRAPISFFLVCVCVRLRACVRDDCRPFVSSCCMARLSWTNG